MTRYRMSRDSWLLLVVLVAFPFVPLLALGVGGWLALRWETQ